MISRPVPIIDPDGSGWVVFETYEEDGRMIAGIYHLEIGELRLGPKAWLARVREHIGKWEQDARNAGCSEMRLRGRDWSRVLPDYEPLDGVPNGLRKVL